MKIAIIHHQFQKKGGMERYFFDLLPGLLAQGDEVDIFVYRQDQSIPVPSGCRVHKKNLSWLPRKWRKYFFANYLAKNFKANDYDLSLSMMRSTCHDATVSGGTHPGCLAHLGRKATAMDQREIEAERKSFESAKFIIAHSNLIAEEIERHYQINPEKIVRLFPPINHQRFHLNVRQKRESVQEKYEINPDKTTLLFPSTGHKRKGLNELLQAMQLLPESEFELLVAGSNFSDQQYKNVRSLGFVDDMTDLYAAVDFTILPSHYEPFGLVVPESIACGTPVIISQFVGAKDLLTDFEGIVFNEVTPKAIIEAIQTAILRDFNIDPNFIHLNNLTVEQHIKAIKAANIKYKELEKVDVDLD